MEERLSAAQGELLAHVRAGVATVTLNRPAALNALSFAMLKALAAWLEAWRDDPRVRLVALRGAGDKSFCAGGDVREIHASLSSGAGIHDEFFAFEYALDYRLHRYPKPVVALLDGIVMGGGMGLSQGAALRIVGGGTRMAMPETAIGLFPDVGASYFLSRVPGRVGLYLGLAGPTIDAADALYCGLADAYFSPEAVSRLPERLAEAARENDLAGALDRLARQEASAPPAPSELERLRPAIDRHFGAPRVEAIVASLEAENAPAFAQWARRTSDALRRHSPTMLKVTFEQLRRGAAMDLADCFRMELGLVHGCIEQGDFAEGVRARLVDKDGAPRWRPASLEAVPDAAVEGFFAPRWSPSAHPLACLR